jgi:hypothetical protein
MIEILDIPQGSPEWFEARRGIPTASEFASVMAKGQGKVRRAYLMRLAAERITGEVQDGYVSRHMERGRALEAEARELYGFVRNVEPQLVGVFIRDGRIGCSPDALLGEDGLLEIKTRLPGLLLEVLDTGAVPSEFRAQVQGGLWITGRRWTDFVAYWPGMPLCVIRVERDEPYLTELAGEVDRFLADLEAVVQRVSTGPATFRDQLERGAAL